MKKYILLAMLGIILVSFISISVYSLIINDNNLPKTLPEIQQADNFSYDPAVSFLDFIKSDPVLRNDHNLMSLNTVDIQKSYYTDNGKEIYLVSVIPQFMWGAELYILYVENNKIADIIKTPLGGNKRFFSYELINISNGTFIAAYCATHAGNGNLELVSIFQPDIIKYSIPFAVDGHYEEMAIAAIEYGLISEYDENIRASAVYLGGKLHADYLDVNQDGYTDIVLSGIRRIYQTGEDDKRILKKEYYVRSVYLYDAEKDKFVLNEQISEEIL
jgi:hypothetical protein